jgi:hypothetical protein
LTDTLSSMSRGEDISILLTGGLPGEYKTVCS